MSSAAVVGRRGVRGGRLLVGFVVLLSSCGEAAPVSKSPKQPEPEPPFQREQEDATATLAVLPSPKRGTDVAIAITDVPERVRVCAPVLVRVMATTEDFAQGRLEVGAYYSNQGPDTKYPLPIEVQVHSFNGGRKQAPIPFVFRFPSSGRFQLSAYVDGLKLVQGSAARAYPGARVTTHVIQVEGTREVELPKPISAPWVSNFETAKSEIRAEQVEGLQKMRTALDNLKPSNSIILYGFADMRVLHGHGGLTNCSLSQNRADAVRDWLIERGATPDRIKAIGKCETSGNWDLARRVEAWVVDYPTCSSM